VFFENNGERAILKVHCLWNKVGDLKKIFGKSADQTGAQQKITQMQKTIDKLS
jgi:hypothetical protein